MLQVRSWIKIADNTGAKIVNVFSVNGKNSNRFARIGDIIAGSVKQVAPNSTLKKGDKVILVGFGTITVSKRSARKGRNPQTGKEINIPAKKVVRFKYGSDLSGTVK